MGDVLETLIEQLRSCWRYRWWALLAAWGVCLLGWFAVIVMPDTYEASARVFVDTRTVLNQVTQGLAVDPNVETQILRVRQALLGGPVLEKVAREAGLTDPNATPQQQQQALAGLRDRIQLTGGKSKDGSTGTGALYVISFKDSNRERSLHVVERLVRTFVEGTLSGNRAGSIQAQKFLVDQIRDYERRLGSTEERLANFKKQNVGLMPGAQGDYFTRLQNEIDGVSKAQAQLAIAQTRRDELQRQIRGQQPVMAGGVQMPTPRGTTLPGTTPQTGAGAQADTASRIADTQAKLDDLLLRFTEKHPDVIALRQTLEDLKARQQADIEAMRRGDPGAAARVGLSSNPVFQSIQLQLNQAEVEMAALKGEIRDRQNRIADLRRLVNTAPEVEAEFARLNRDYDVTKGQYQALTERLQRARLSEDADATGGVHMELIDPPSAGFKPIAPNRRQLIMLLLFVGVGAGGGLAYLLQQMNPVFNSSKQLTAVTGLPVLGMVSMTWLEKHRVQERQATFAFAGAVCALILVSGAVFVLQAKAVVFARTLLG